MRNKPNSTEPTSERLPPLRTSRILRGILENNPDVETFDFDRILAAIGSHRFEASLMMFAIPGIVPVPVPLGAVALPTGVIACQLVAGKQEIELPAFILKTSVSRRSLAVAIHTLLPVIEAAEQLVRPRWSWVSHPLARRVIGLFIFLLAVAIAQPVFGFTALQSLSICIMSLGMAEHDGLAVILGFVAGAVSLALLGSSALSTRLLRAGVSRALRKISRKLGCEVLGKALDRRGHELLATIVRCEWSELLLMWDPEKPSVERTQVHGHRELTHLDHLTVGQLGPGFRLA
jgi:hypothetical protein